MATMITRPSQRVPLFKRTTRAGLSTETFTRQYQRVPFFCRLTLTVLPTGTTVEAYSFDISLGGVGLNAQIPCSRGNPVRVSFFLKGPGGERVENVPGRIAYVGADESGTRIGIEFDEALRESSCPVLTRRLQNL